MASRIVRGALIGLAAVVLIGIALAGYYFLRVAPLIRAGKQQGVYDSVAARRSVAGFAFETADGARHSLADFRGKVMVVDVWATWCGTCLFTIPDVVSLRRKYPVGSVQIVGLSVDEEGWAKVKPFLRKHPEINYTMAVPSPAPSFLLQSIVDLDPLGEVSAIPTFFVIDRKGMLAGKFIETGHTKEIDDLISTLIKE